MFELTEEEFKETEISEMIKHDEKVRELEHSCKNCEHYNPSYPLPLCLDCKTGFNDDWRKRDYFIRSK